MNISNCVASQKTARCLLTALAVSSIQFSSTHFANAATVLPANVKSTCAFSSAEFNSIFESGSVSNNGGVVPAHSFSFTPNSLCSFYKWSVQMFLWLTSPVPSGTHVFDSPLFFGVSPLDANGQRNLIPNAPGRSLPFLPTISQRGNQRKSPRRHSAGCRAERRIAGTRQGRPAGRDRPR